MNELLEMEIAGARIAFSSSDAAPASSYRELMDMIRLDDAHWCAVLSRHICRLGGVPTRKCASFRVQALAIPDPMERLFFLNSGQKWLVERIEALMTHVQDGQIFHDLGCMAERHRATIAAISALGPSGRVCPSG